jgi:hypothetical protein
VTYEIRWGGEVEDVRVTYAGPASTEEAIESFRALRASAKYRPGLRVLLDHRAADWTNVTAADIRRRAEAVLAGAPDDGHVVATVVDRKLAFGLMRMLQAFVDDRLTTVEQLFYDVESARAWLRESLM